MDADTLRVARDKLVRVFRYLEALNQHRNPAKKQIADGIAALAAERARKEVHE